MFIGNNHCIIYFHQLVSLCGNHLSEPLTGSGSELFVLLETDPLIEANGFKLKYGPATTVPTTSPTSSGLDG